LKQYAAQGKLPSFSLCSKYCVLLRNANLSELVFY
jgi:sRNA-binding regulator protein Hfq